MLSVAFTEGQNGSLIRTYGSRAVLTTLPLEKASRNDTVISPVFQQILDLPGVAHIYGTAYELVVQIGELYTWDEVHPRVMEILTLANSEPVGKQ